MNDSGARYILEFSKEAPEAVQLELRSVQTAYGTFSIDFFNGWIAKIRGDIEPAKRLSFLRYASRILTEAEDINELRSTILPPGRFHVRISHNDTPSSVTESQIGDIIGGKGRISFSSPDFVVRAIFSEKWYLCILEFQADRNEMEARKAPLRPFFSPVSMHPKFARFMVNSLSLKPGAVVLDPFCGTGGILIEAAKLGYRIIGNDISLKMFKGVKLNLKYMSISDYKLYNKDFLDLKSDEKINGIATDLPYGRNSSAGTYDIEQLYSMSLEKFASLLDSGEKCSIAVSTLEVLKIAESHFRSAEVISVRQHRSLTRHFITLTR
ncbi:MAG: methyltransferase [Candidatus Thermoplasmatota archaeon]|jgi:tRNA (guanine10-N2)-dimethyltransferase|nr:methyltransferase [Candidatus Thermoplasmatota archaeon]MCL5793573.1 methyltransferase [Candidatus Thermoplasmatota archaeon]